MTPLSRFASLAAGVVTGVALALTAVATVSAAPAGRSDAVWSTDSVNDTPDESQTPPPVDPAKPDDAVWG